MNRESRALLEAALAELDAVAGPAVGNFLFADTGEDSQGLFEALLREGVIVRPTHGFGAPTAIRVSVGTPDETEFFAAGLARVRAAATA